ncbi:MAG: hypothetical protein NTV06_05960 [candidate division Zixibacteria bacterium]|nr:hypothetical protein [candidate division Zixibacteria bacterium]
MRKWHRDSKTKAKIVLEGLSGLPTGELLTEADRALEGKADGSEMSRLKVKTQKLQQIIGALTVIGNRVK